MIYLDWLNRYCEHYKIILRPHEGRLKGHHNTEIKLLVFLLKSKFGLSYRCIANNLFIERSSGFRFYYAVLANPIYRKIAEDRWKEISNEDYSNHQTRNQ